MFGLSIKFKIFWYPYRPILRKKLRALFSDFSFFGPQKFISAQEDKLEKHTFSTLIIEFFCQSKLSCTPTGYYWDMYCILKKGKRHIPFTLGGLQRAEVLKLFFFKYCFGVNNRAPSFSYLNNWRWLVYCTNIATRCDFGFSWFISETIQGVAS
jgi:hypothetical protein